MKILILVESFNINHHSSAIGRSKFISALLNKKNNVTIIYPDESVPHLKNLDPTWLSGCKFKRFALSAPTRTEKILDRIPKIRAIPTYLSGFHMSFHRLILDWKLAIETELQNETYDLVIALGTGMSFAPHFALAQSDVSIPWIANIHDPYPVHFYPPPYNKKPTLLYKNQAKRFHYMLRKASCVTFPSLRLQEWMEQFYPEIKSKSFVIPHLAPSDEMIASLPTTDKDTTVSLQKGKFNILHAGSLLGPRNPAYLLKAFLRFISEDSERKKKAVLNIIGKVAKEHTGFEKAYEPYKSNINIVLERVGYRHSLSLLKDADVLVLLEAVSEVSPFMPGKLADYIWADRPILALTPKNSETSRILGKSYPYRVDTDDEEGIYRCLVDLWERWKKGDGLSLNNSELRHYVSAERMNHILEGATCLSSQK